MFGPVTWESVLNDLVVALASSDDPLVFVLGAGCSISSGGPTTIAAFRQLDEGLQRLTAAQRSFASGQSPAEKRARLQPAFAEFSPGIGYLLLASLARGRKVYVINFNWDLGVEMAAKKLGVPCERFEPRHAKWSTVQLRKCGIQVVHVHGSLNGDPLARATETSTFPEQLEDLLDKLWKFPKVCVGVDLGFELDFYHFIDSRKKSRSESSKPWYFSRGASLEDGHLDKLERIEALLRASVTPDFDFDLFMIGLAGRLKKHPFAKVAELLDEPPQLRELCLPGNDRLVPLVDSQPLCLAAEPKSGASTLALLVAYLRYLLAEAALAPLLVEGLAATKATLGNGLTAASGEPGEEPVIVVADDVLDGAPDEDPQLLDILRLIGEQRRNVTLVAPLKSVVRLRVEHAAEFEKTFGQVVEVRDGEPYTPAVLRAFAARLGQPATFLDAVDGGLVHLPRQCRDGRPSPKAPLQPGAEAELESDPDLRQFVMTARLVELSARDKTVAELERVAQRPMSSLPSATLSRYVSTYHFENKRWFQVSPHKRVLADRLLGARAEELKSLLKGRDVALLFEFDQWLRFLKIARTGASDGGLEAERLRRLTSAVLDERWTAEQLQSLLSSPSVDSWGATNLAYALVANWECFDASRRRLALDGLLGRRDVRGCYAVTEAALFLGRGTAPEVWSSLQSACWRLLSDDPAGEEMCLVVDAFMWRPPLHDKTGWQSLVTQYFGTIRCDSRHGGALRFFAAYHAEGLAELYPDWEAQDETLDWTEEQSQRAAWLVEWHFAHLTFSRTIGFRFGRNDKDMLCRALHEQRHQPIDKAQRHLLSSLLRYSSTAGWGFHAACWMAGKHGWLSEKAGEKLMLDLLRASGQDDRGLITGFVGFEAPRRLTNIRDAFKEAGRRSAVVKIVEGGIVLDCQPFTASQFQFVHDVVDLWHALELRHPNIEREELDREDAFRALLNQIEASADEVLLAGVATNISEVAAVAEGIRMRTRLPSLEQAIPAREREVSLGRHVLEVMLQMAAEGRVMDSPSPQLQLPLL